ncbi:glucocorticoid-induced transcript 1 protein-like isoform X3 [Limulus polyphemus]|uniref:Glucocorticoid-induced transcript 1 protein-like isoform X3 n=1 Tax=Limulus polyphemus TaxID=6850 RepID=A0ABM1TFB7_LIMPO|nr:glucocorticoid-induced transcript 1 protein-like isoform X3 [Limulus polyphemus]
MLTKYKELRKKKNDFVLYVPVLHKLQLELKTFIKTLLSAIGQLKFYHYKMSEQTPQRVRRTGSPVSPGSTKQCPLKATMPVSMMRQINSPTRFSNKMSSSSHSPTCNTNRTSEGTRLMSRQSPDLSLRLGLSVDRRSPGSPGYKADKTSSVNFKPITSAPCIRRTASLDTIYLAGQWPRDLHYHSYYVRHVMDRATQTDEWEETEKIKKGPQKKSPGNNGDQLEMKYFRHRLQRTNKSGHGQGNYSSLQRLSPFQGDHSAISLSTAASSNNGSVCLSLPSTATLPLNNSPYQHLYSIPTYNVSHERSQTGPIPIPHIPKTPIPRILSSVEGLNQEIERLVLKGISGNDSVDMEIERELEPPPDGHRAPIADLFKSTTVTTTRNVDTQTPSGREESCSGSGANSYSQSVSPTVPFLGQMDSSQPASRGSKSASPDLDWSTKLGTSPRINKFLAREPPDGCERVKIVDERRNTSAIMEPQRYGPYKPSEKFVLLPSQSSAFYPLYKTYVSPSTSDSALQKLTSSTLP